MRIDKLRIKNFKGFEEETFLLNPHFTVFIGDNAKGKTSVLDALAVASGSFLRGIDVATIESRGIDKNEIRIITNDGEPLPQLPAEVHAFGEVAGENIEEGWLRTVDKLSPKKTTTTFVKAKNIESIAEKMLRARRSGEKVTFPVIAYHGTGRLWAQHEEKKAVYKKTEEGVSQAYLNCLSPKSSSKEFLSWYKTYEDEIRKFDQESDKVLLKAFNSTVISMIPDNHWQEMAYSFAAEDLVGVFLTPNGKREKLQFKQLSDGYRNIIGMVADIAYRCIKLNPHLGENAVKQTPGIVLIDELDLNLHPNWQKRIVEDLKQGFPNIQFVATTHSPFIVQSLKSEELIILDEQIKKDGDPDMKGIEDVAANEMGVEDVPRSEAFLEMQKVAEEYYALVQQGKTSKTDKQTEELRNKLNELEERFSNDPAFVASLRIERQANDL
ncbi:MAG: AAA family ATPase [Chitinophagaceae bacterium]|nr:AAA family ATPase [Chitinophagaceae bacterium]